MADHHGGSRDDEPVSEPALDWLDEIAESEGLSREAAVEYLVSSYWRLEEIVDLLEAGETQRDAPSADEPPDGRLDRTDSDELQDRFDSLLDDLRTGGEMGDDRARLLSSMVELGDRLEQLERRLADEPLDADQGGELGDDELATLEARLDELEAAVAGVEDRVDRLVEESVREETFAAVTEQTRSFQDSITRQQDSLRDRVRTEFEHIRTILTHLLDTTSANEARTERLVGEFEDTFRAHLARRERLETIVRTANRRGVREAACEHCEQPVDLAMLQSPVCPGCEHRFTDVETSTGPFGLFPSHVLRVANDADGPSRQSDRR